MGHSYKPSQLGLATLGFHNISFWNYGINLLRSVIGITYKVIIFFKIASN
nr:MAG TPA: hypothetical protein [Caudoviricetes sp.]